VEATFHSTFYSLSNLFAQEVQVTPDSISFIIGSIIMLVGVILPLSVMILKNKKVFAKQKS